MRKSDWFWLALLTCSQINLICHSVIKQCKARLAPNQHFVTSRSPESVYFHCQGIDTNKMLLSQFFIHPCDPTVVICYLIWPCDIAVCITYLVSHSSSLTYNAVIKGYFRLGVYRILPNTRAGTNTKKSRGAHVFRSNYI